MRTIKHRLHQFISISRLLCTRAITYLFYCCALPCFFCGKASCKTVWVGMRLK